MEMGEKVKTEFMLMDADSMLGVVKAGILQYMERSDEPELLNGYVA
jgi:hypothetical protein